MKSHHLLRVCHAGCLAPVMFAIVLLGSGGEQLRAASILWGSPATISGDSDVSTTGTLLAAVNPGANVSGGLATTVNGVTFAAFGPQGVASATDSSGRFTIESTTAGYSVFSTTGLGSASPPFSLLSSSYQTLLSYASYISNSGQTDFSKPMTMTINGLTSGGEYAVQLWFNDSRPFSTGPLTGTSETTSVSLDPNVTDAPGALGQQVIGTFTADGTTQAIVFSTTGNAVGLSAYQLRLLPEPGSAALVLAGIAVLAMRPSARRR